MASLPYSVATGLVLHHVASPLLTDAFVMVQEEVGQRWAAAPGDGAYGAPTVKLALVADVETVLAIPRSVFLPAPHVDSVMVRVSPRPDAPGPAAAERVGAVVDAAFMHRRKTLRNSLGAAIGRDAAEQACRQAGIDPSLRPERLSAADFRRLAKAVEGPVAGA